MQTPMRVSWLFALFALTNAVSHCCARTVVPVNGRTEFLSDRKEGAYGSGATHIEWSGGADVYVEREFNTNMQWPIKAYGVRAANGTYTEVVRTKDKVYEAQSAREFLTHFYKKSCTSRDAVYLLYAFELVQRIVTPHGLLGSVLSQVFDPEHYKNYTERTLLDEKRPKPQNVVIRTYAFNVTNDKPKHYTDRQLDKLFTRWRSVMTPEQVKGVINQYTHVEQYDTPIKFVRAMVTYYPEKDVDELRELSLHEDHTAHWSENNVGVIRFRTELDKSTF